MFGDGRINIIATIITILIINIVYFFSRKINLIYLNSFIFVLIFLSVVSEQFLNSNIQWSLKEWKTKNTNFEYSAIDNLRKNLIKPEVVVKYMVITILEIILFQLIIF